MNIIKKSVDELLSKLLELSSAIDSASKTAMLQTMAANMNSLQLAMDDSLAAYSLSTQLSSALAAGPQNLVRTTAMLIRTSAPLLLCRNVSCCLQPPSDSPVAICFTACKVAAVRLQT